MNRFIRKTFCASFLMASLGLSGCATIVSDSHYPVNVSTVPTGAEFVVRDNAGNEVFAGQTPTTVVLKSGAGFFTPAKYSFEFSKEGHKATQKQLTAEFDSWYLGNILFGGLIGMLIVDPASGAMWELPWAHSTSLIKEDVSATAVNDFSIPQLETEVPESGNRESAITDVDASEPESQAAVLAAE